MHERSLTILIAAQKFLEPFTAPDLARIAYSELSLDPLSQRRNTMRIYSFLRTNPKLFAKTGRGLWRINRAKVRRIIEIVEARKKLKLLKFERTQKWQGIPELSKLLAKFSPQLVYDLSGKLGTTQSFNSAAAFVSSHALTPTEVLSLLMKHGLHFVDRLVRFPTNSLVIYFRFTDSHYSLANHPFAPFLGRGELSRSDATVLGIERAFNHAFGPWNIGCHIRAHRRILHVEVHKSKDTSKAATIPGKYLLIEKALVRVLRTAPREGCHIREILNQLPPQLPDIGLDQIESQARVVLSRHRQLFQKVARGYWRLLA